MIINSSSPFHWITVFPQIRRMIGDFGVPIALFIMVGIDLVIKDVETQVWETIISKYIQCENGYFQQLYQLNDNSPIDWSWFYIFWISETVGKHTIFI